MINIVPVAVGTGFLISNVFLNNSGVQNKNTERSTASKFFIAGNSGLIAAGLFSKNPSF